MAARLGLKVDVDTWQGFREGVPALLQVLGERGIKASFYVALGPDHSGRARRGQRPRLSRPILTLKGLGEAMSLGLMAIM